METKKKTPKPIINQDGYDLLMDHILRPSATSITKPYEQLLADEVKRHIAACINLQFSVQS